MKNMKYILSFFSLESIFFCEFLHCFLSKKCAIRFDKETANKNKQFTDTKTWISIHTEDQTKLLRVLL